MTSSGDLRTIEREIAQLKGDLKTYDFAIGTYNGLGRGLEHLENQRDQCSELLSRKEKEYDGAIKRV